MNPSEVEPHHVDDYEERELSIAKSSGFYTLCAGKHEEIDGGKDEFGNPIEADLVEDGKCTGHSILVGNFCVATDAPDSFELPCKAWRKKGFTIIEVKTEPDFIRKLPTVDIAIVISGSNQLDSPSEFLAGLKTFHKAGKGIWLWTDNAPYYQHANAMLFPMFGIIMDSSTLGDKVLSLAEKSGKDPDTGFFKRHLITTGIIKLFEGVTISYPVCLGQRNVPTQRNFPFYPFKVLAKSTDGHPVSLYADNQFLEPNSGRILLDGGFTKLYMNWKDAGAARYIVNGVIWLLAKERELMKMNNNFIPAVIKPVLPIVEAASETPKKIIVAVDFGTSYSGFGYIYLANSNRIYKQDSWQDSPTRYCKNLTQLLYARDLKKILSHGYRSTKQIADMDDASDVFLFKYFKMGIHENPSGIVWDTTKTVQKPALNVVVDYLKEFREAILLHFREMANIKANPSEIKWCLTIPAIWTHKEKDLMKKAAYAANLCTSENPSQESFRLVLEPEAAAVFCLDVLKRQGHELPDGITFLIVDAGGGTVDLTSHRKVAGTLKEINPGSGGSCGSSILDERFLAFLETEISPPVLNDLKHNNKLAFLELMAKWEEFKCTIDSLSTDYMLQIPAPVQQFFANNQIKCTGYRGITGKFKISASQIRDIFEPVIREISTLVENQISQAMEESNVKFDYIFIVGGFGQSKVLQNEITEKFSSKISKSVFAPNKGGEAIVDGAILYAANASVISTRKARMTIGVKSIKPFGDRWCDPAKKTVFDDRPGEWCNDCFDPYVVCGQEFSINQVIGKTLHPTSASQTEMVVELYQTPKKNPIYVTEQGCSKLGDIIINMSTFKNTYSENLNRIVRISMKFGDVEIDVKAVNETTKEEYRSVLKFDGRQWKYS